MWHTSISPENTVFVILSFEGPDGYSMAGGLGVRVNYLSSTLAGMGYRTHLFFIGDPALPGEEARHGGCLVLHRWGQWISRFHPNGVYDGEDGKLYDFNESIPQFIKDRIIKPAVGQGNLVAILGEEWHTAEAMCRIRDIVQSSELGDRVIMFWNANNTFSFDRIDWERLKQATSVTTVSRYMKHIMRSMDLNPLVIPNGIPRRLLRSIDTKLVQVLRHSLDTDLIMSKVARWDPDKGWNAAVEATAELKEKGIKVTLIARGGIEPYGGSVMDHARSSGLTVRQIRPRPRSWNDFIFALQQSAPAEIVDVRSPLPLDFLRVVYRASDNVLANSSHEPFGIVGLETMAAGGVAFTGCTGEDYAIPFVNCFVLDTAHPMEVVDYLLYLRSRPEESNRIRKAARHTAGYFTWDAVARHLISKLENQARIQEVLLGQPRIELLCPPALASPGVVESNMSQQRSGRSCSERRYSSYAEDAGQGCTENAGRRAEGALLQMPRWARAGEPGGTWQGPG